MNKFWYRSVKLSKEAKRAKDLLTRLCEVLSIVGGRKFSLEMNAYNDVYEGHIIDSGNCFCDSDDFYEWRYDSNGQDYIGMMFFGGHFSRKKYRNNAISKAWISLLEDCIGIGELGYHHTLTEHLKYFGPKLNLNFKSIDEFEIWIKTLIVGKWFHHYDILGDTWDYNYAKTHSEQEIEDYKNKHIQLNIEAARDAILCWKICKLYDKRFPYVQTEYDKDNGNIVTAMQCFYAQGGTYGDGSCGFPVWYTEAVEYIFGELSFHIGIDGEKCYHSGQNWIKEWYYDKLNLNCKNREELERKLDEELEK